MPTQTGKRDARPRKLFVPEPVEILGADVLETIHEWEDVDGDLLRSEYRNEGALDTDG
jgi:hypothetical protein